MRRRVLERSSSSSTLTLRPSGIAEKRVPWRTAVWVSSVQSMPR